MTCPACGADAFEGAVFCSECGTRLATVASQEERRVVTALFCDLVGSTSLGERTDPEELDRLLGRYYTLASETITRHTGTVQKFIGDAVVALFGYPVAHEDDPSRALAAALEIVEQVGSSGLGLELRLGVNTGEAFVRTGASGEWNATGDVMNIASRLQTVAPPMGVVVGTRTRLAALPAFEFDELPPLKLKGKEGPVPAWRLLGTAALTDEAGGATMVGREAELVRLRETVAGLNGHGGGAVLVEGEAGIGKSRLVREARESLPGITWLRGRCIETRDASGYRPFAELIRAWSGSEWSTVAARSEALGLGREEAGFLATIAGIEPEADLVARLGVLDADAMRPALYRSVLAWLEALAGTGPVVLEFEDWHWADGASIQLAGHVLPLIETRPLLVLMLARPDAAPSGVLSGFLTPALQQRVERFELTPLGTADAEVLLRELIAEQPSVPPERITAALAQAEGNPYFLTELSRFLTEDSDGGALPDTVRAVVTARADRLAPDLKKLLRSAATIGRTFADDLLTQLERDDSVESRLEQLVATGLIEPIPPDRHRFVHALTREAIYEGIPIADRTRLHAEVAAVLSAREQDSDLPAVAYHLAQAEDWEAAASALVNAGEQAARLAADDDALEMYRAAIAAHEHLPTDRWGPLERSRIDRRVAETLVRLGRHEEARKQLIGALARLGLAFPDGTGAVKRATLRHLAPRLLGPSPLPPADTTPEPIDAELCQELVLLVWISYFRDHDDLALATFMLANRAARAGCLDGFAEGTCMSAAAFASLGREKLARAYMRRAAEAVDRMTDEIEVARVTRSLSLIPTALGDFEEVRVWTERGIDLGAAAGDLRSRGAASALLGLALFMHGEFGRARALGDAIVRDAAEGGERPIQAMGFAVTSLCHGLQPEVAARAAEAAQAGIEVALTVPDHLLHTLCQGNLARAQLRLGDLDAASASIDAGLRERSKRGFRGPISFFPVLAEAELALLELARGRTRATVAANRRAIRRSLRLAPYARWHAVYAETTSGGCAWILGKKRVAERAFARADALADRYDWPGALADASLWVARCCEEAGVETPPSLSFALTHTQSTSRV